MPSTPFIKTNACGNDFILIDGAHAPDDMAALTRAICDRHLGVGADGVEWLFPDPKATARAHLLNADGSDAELSGNGTRCVASYLISERGGQSVTVRTGAGIRTCTLTARSGNRFEFDMQMGEPQVGDPFAVKLAFREITGIPISMGNPQFIVFVDEFETGWQAEAAEIGRHHDFKYGTNVEMVKVTSKEDIEIRIFERGAGETQSSGTGSCASAVAAIHSGRAQSPLRVHAPGGTQVVRWENNEVFLRGPAQIVCHGEFFW
jgi:diaminopimelate epimerase